jgi:manganese oxidase
LLVADDADKVSVTNGERCPATAPVKDYHVTAINIEITLSRFLDYFPGYMYVLNENLDKVRAEETVNKEAREKENDPGALSNGLQGDVIQPLVIRANQGDCLKLTLHNQIADEPTNLVINGSSMVVSSTGKPATPSNPDTTVAVGKQQGFEWYIKPDTQEGARFLRSHASREQFNLGLIGMLVVEPRGSRYLSPFDGKPMASGWEAMIEDPKGADFREFAIFYHEAGDEAFRILNKKGEMLPQRDPHTDSYRPGARLLNYRSEPHGTRIELQAHMGFYGDESMAYGSYTFGDPATTIPRS